MFEIAGDHISKLNDEDLRSLVTRLCEAELRRCGLPLSAVTAGGDQNAPDGGVDVRVNLSDNSTCLDFIPRPLTGFQVKRSDMPASKITAEMCPEGELRQSIRDLAIAHGAYLIVSSQGSTADSALQDRRKAMRAAVGDLGDGAAIHLDFYDRERIANWVRSYTGVGLWVRERIAKPLSGWRGYGNWALGDPTDSEYLLDDKGRIVSKQSGSHEPMIAERGIEAMRAILAHPGGIIRLIGLSGVGKTRLVQALFDSRVGSNALDSAVVAYTDQGHEPNPSAREMLHQLGTSGLRAIIVVDNCNPDTHRVLAQIVKAHTSTLSLITVEYDVSEDEPEETQVFELEPASEKVLEEILKRMTPHVSLADRNRIAEFSGGNARVALALAKTISNHEGLGSLNDAGLFKRLFHQRQESDENLLRAAEVCSLVYSFDGETLEGDTAELPILAELANLSAKELYRYVGELRARDLVQRRGRWRAVLPHAIANRLARQAFDRIPTNLIIAAFVPKSRERLLKSFSRRLSYLHDCEPAKKIAEGWLSDTNWLADPAHLNELGIALFHNIAPLIPTHALNAIEAAALGKDGSAFISPDAPNRWRWAALLRALAYESDLFDRAAFLLARYYAAEPENYRHNSTRDAFRELFHLYLSGTHALPEQRLALIRRLLNSDNSSLQVCALEALDAMLEAWHFSSSHDFSFGARSRDFGWQPKTQAELSTWFRAALSLARELALSTSPYREKVKSILARRFRALWMKAGIHDDIKSLARELAAQDGWADGWIALRMIIRFDIDRMVPELAQQLRNLEADLRPRDLTHKIHAYVLSKTHHHLDIADVETDDDSGSGHQKAWEKVNQIVEELGRQTANTPEVLVQLLPELLRSGFGQHWQFGRGVAMEISDLTSLWRQCRSVLATLPDRERSISLMQGFIAAATKRDPGVASQLLDEAVTDSILGPYFPLLQASVRIDESGVQRLLTSLTIGHAQAGAYQSLGYGQVTNDIPSSTYRRIVLAVANLPDGFPVALDLFTMRLYSLKSDKVDIDQETLGLGRDLLIRIDFQVDDENFAYHVNEIAVACLQGPDASDTTLKLCVNLARALSDYRTGAWHYRELAGTLFRLQPQAALNILLSGQRKPHRTSLLSMFSNFGDSPVNCTAPDVLLAWANQDPTGRYPQLAKEICLFKKNGDHEKLAWSPLAQHLLKHAPDRTSVLKIFSSRFRPTSWMGSLADVLTPYLHMVRELSSNPDTVIAAWARDQEISLAQQIEAERQRDRRVDESFE